MTTRKRPSGRHSDSLAVVVLTLAFNDAGQRAAIAHQELGKLLAANKRVHLADDIWAALWASRLDATTAQYLVDRPLTSDQLDTVIADEHRVNVLAAALDANTPNDAQLAAVLAKPCGGNVARATRLLDCASMSEQRWKAWCLAAGGLHGVTWLAEHPDVDPTGYLADPSWVGRPNGDVVRGIVRLVESWPDAVAGLSQPGAHATLVCEAAASHWLAGRQHLALDIATRMPDDANDTAATVDALCDAWRALVYNPVVGNDVIDALRAHVEALSQRAFTSFSPRRFTEVVDVIDGWRSRPAYDRFTRNPTGDLHVLTATDKRLWAERVDPWRRRYEVKWYRSMAATAAWLATDMDCDSDDQRGPLTDALCHAKTSEVLGLARASRLAKRYYPNVVVRTTKRSVNVPYVPQPRIFADGDPVSLWSAHMMDDRTAQTLGQALTTEEQWQVLFNLLSDAENGEDLRGLIATASALCSEP